MNGPDHYREAERLLAESRTELRPNDEGHCEADRTIAEAQVHATLALAAATRDAGIPRGQVLVEQCHIAESAYGRQCGKADGHTGDCDFEGGAR
jgi:hypothetical protein